MALIARRAGEDAPRGVEGGAPASRPVWAHLPSVDAAALQGWQQRFDALDRDGKRACLQQLAQTMRAPQPDAAGPSLAVPQPTASDDAVVEDTASWRACAAPFGDVTAWLGPVRAAVWRAALMQPQAPGCAGLESLAPWRAAVPQLRLLWQRGWPRPGLEAPR